MKEWKYQPRYISAAASKRSSWTGDTGEAFAPKETTRPTVRVVTSLAKRVFSGIRANNAEFAASQTSSERHLTAEEIRDEVFNELEKAMAERGMK